MKNKNGMYLTNDNEYADKLLCIIENTGVLSDKLNNRITGLVLFILTNHEKNIDRINESINYLEKDLSWLNVFSSDFITTVIVCLRNALKHEIDTANKIK